MTQVSIDQALQIALSHHQAGRLPEAETIYRQILAQQPRHADVLHLLGVLASQVHRPDIAADLLRQALAIKPNFPNALNDLGNALQDKGQLDDAITAYRQAIALQPHFTAAHNNLGNALRLMGQFDDAIAAYRQAITLEPNLPQAHNNLGAALKDKRQLDDAIAAYRQAIALQPAYPDAYCNLGNALQEKGQLDDAIAAFRQALALKSNHHESCASLGNALQLSGQFEQAIAAYRQVIALQSANHETYSNLGNALRETGQLDDSLAACRQAIALKPDYPEAHNNLGNTLRLMGQFDDAIAAYHQAIALKPDYPEAYSNLGNALKDKGLLDETLTAYRQALALKPDYPEAHSNEGYALQQKGQLDDALAAYRQAIALKPNYAEAHNNLGNALKDKGLMDEALAAYRQAIALKPDYPEAHSNLILTLLYHPDYDARAVAEECRRWNRQHAEPLKKFIQPHPNDRNPGRRLRIGYVSPDFHAHVIGKFLLPWLAHHDKNNFEIFAYAQVPAPDATTQLLRSSTDAWRNITHLSDAQAAALIRQDRIDILVDLAMHTGGSRLTLFARKPAPVQVTWLGYPGGTGLTTIDYRLTDPYLDPPGMDESVYSEQTVRLPDSFWCYEPLDGREIAVNSLPALEKDTLTFGCLNNFCKVNHAALHLWARVLQAMPASRLLLLAPAGSPRQDALELFTQEGIDPRRIEFSSRLSRLPYLEMYHHIDIGLDTFPYNGHTTSLDSFWMGVPVVTLAGQKAVSRAGVCQLMNLQLPELIAQTPEDFVRIASDLAHDLPRLSNLRSTLRQRMTQSPLMDAPRFARNLEAAYRQMWRTWCASPVK